MSHGTKYRYPDLETSVARHCPAGHPLVLRCHPLRLVKGRPLPFPTLYWLDCRHVQHAISVLEHRGLIKLLQEKIRGDSALRAGVEKDHAEYVARRAALLRDDDLELLERHGMLDEYNERGIGGIRCTTAIKCLHLHYAHHLMHGSTVGRLIDEAASVVLCAPAEVAT